MGNEAQNGRVVCQVETWWTGPVVVQKRTGDASYEVGLLSGELHAVHADRLKPCVQGEPVDLYHFEAGYAQEEVTPREWELKNILGHLWVADKPQFLTQWEGAASGGDVEAAGQFCPPVFLQAPGFLPEARDPAGSCGAAQWASTGGWPVGAGLWKGDGPTLDPLWFKIVGGLSLRGG